ncbi:hypothetical protein SAMN06265222_101560 [Neorhodopirellula lusitana]|uniref:Uncharacterized protein n=1 Tax=Neorhodopirellula lusitana TaxID=445327 RepID=A0ABY1PPT6_9BACT|nr:hypothetical protein [Neorhodopirellula lusitana]SMP41299.1 hypothetical protein SAMN06265222_101560 [Neorhodopirellula lusitana]
MPRGGGEADKIGNHYESVWTVDALINLHRGRYCEMEIESFGEDSAGVEFQAKTESGTVEFHSLKRQTQSTEWSIAALTGPAPSTGRSILGDLAEKLDRHPTARLKFISATGANRLRELIDRARNVADVSEFRSILSEKLSNQFNVMVRNLTGGDEAQCLSILKSVEEIPRGHDDLIRSVDQRIEEYFHLTDGGPMNSADLRRELAEFAIRNLGRKLNIADVRDHVESLGYGIRDWKNNKRIRDLQESTNEAYRSVAEAELINGGSITRSEAVVVLGHLTRSECRGVLVKAPAGFGKSCLIAQVVSGLVEREIECLCIRMDNFQPCQTTMQVGKQLDLPDSPARILAGIADGDACVLVVDQLDAMSLVSGRHSSMWDVFQRLLNEVAGYPNMYLLLACRDFDLEHDARLRGLANKFSGFEQVTIEKLTQEQIFESIELAGHEKIGLSDKQHEILSCPFHLLLFLEGDPTKPFSTSLDLYNEFWDRKRFKLKERLGREAAWDEVIEYLTHRMSEDQLLFAPSIGIDQYSDDVKAMVSEHVLVRSGESLRFFHESFFDYAFARHFCRARENIVNLLESSEQHMFRRSQVRQILTFRRGSDRRRYLADLKELLESEKVRFHIKRMVASALGQIADPQHDEWEIIQHYFLETDLSRYVSVACRDHVGWFDTLNDHGYLEKWLASSETIWINAAIWILEASDLHNERSEQIAAMIAPYLGRGGDWTKRLQRIMSWGISHKSKAMSDIYLAMIRDGSYDDFQSPTSGDSDFWTQHYNAEKESPRFLIDVLATWFEKTASDCDDGKSDKFMDRCKLNHSHCGTKIIAKAGQDDPVYFAQRMLPIIRDVVLQSLEATRNDGRDRAWPYITGREDHFDIDDVTLDQLAASLGHIAKEKPGLLREIVGDMPATNSGTFAYLLLKAWIENAGEFADECVEYILRNESRLDVGPGGRISCMALAAISPYCTDENLTAIESLINGYCDEYESRTPQIRGRDELYLLRCLDSDRISEPTKMRIEMLERKFPNLPEQSISLIESFGWSVEKSSIPDEKSALLRDENWISAMRKYPGSRPLGNQLREATRTDRIRFAQLALNMDDDLHPDFFTEILHGISNRFCDVKKEDRESEALQRQRFPLELLEKALARIHRLPERPCGSAIVTTIGVFAKRTFSKSTLEILCCYALNDPSPLPSDTNVDFGDESLIGLAINSVRGQAAESISHLLFADETRYDVLMPTLEALVCDESMAVRAAAINSVLPALNFESQAAIELFSAACGGKPEIASAYTWKNFCNYAVLKDPDAILSLIEEAFRSDTPKSIKNATALIAHAHLSEIDTGTLLKEARNGTDDMRRKLASVYAHNIDNEHVGKKCQMALVDFYDDSSEEVRQRVGLAFSGLSGDFLREHETSLLAFISSRSFETYPESLLRSMEQSSVELPEVTCAAAERVLGFLGEEGTHIAYHGSMIARSISKLVVRQYEQTRSEVMKVRCLDLIDKMERVGYMGISDELSRLER